MGYFLPIRLLSGVLAGQDEPSLALFALGQLAPDLFGEQQDPSIPRRALCYQKSPFKEPEDKFADPPDGID
ncbi:MAG: hypothetical protein JNN12_12885 [Bacteroidetes Order II. Incertae sedis bacterium]|nr:hypothetical protein [Bacteroidetes Order II. bacterium]